MVGRAVAVMALAVGAASALGACSLDSLPLDQAEVADEGARLFLLYSDRGSLRAAPDGGYAFTMIEPWNTAVVFTDRPFRDADDMPLSHWVAGWADNGFDRSPPNAAITMSIQPDVGETDWAVMTLLDPRFLSDGSLAFDASFLALPDGSDAFYPTAEGSSVKPEFFETQVFIDSAAAPASPSAQGLAASLLPRPVKGMCYVPAPSDYKTICTDAAGDAYYDSDFYNADFRQLWGTTGTPARGDLQRMAALNVNFLHLYDWNVPSARNHLPFLAEAQARGMKVAVPISNYFVNQQSQTAVEEIVSEITQNNPPAVVMWAIGNEIDTGYRPAADQVATIAKWISDKDNSRLITVPLALPFEGKMTSLKDAFDARGLTDVWNTNFVASINVYDDAPAVEFHVESFGRQFPSVPLLISEMNRPRSVASGTASGQATQLLQQFTKSNALVADGQHASFFGSYVFQWMAKPWECDADEKSYGIHDFKAALGTGMTTAGVGYPVDDLAPNPLYSSVQQAFQ